MTRLARARQLAAAMSLHRSRRDLEFGPRNELLRFQRERFLETVRHAAARSPLYRELYAGVDCPGTSSPARCRRSPRRSSSSASTTGSPTRACVGPTSTPTSSRCADRDVRFRTPSGSCPAAGRPVGERCMRSTATSGPSASPRSCAGAICWGWRRSCRAAGWPASCRRGAAHDRALQPEHRRRRASNAAPRRGAAGGSAARRARGVPARCAARLRLRHRPAGLRAARRAPRDRAAGRRDHERGAHRRDGERIRAAWGVEPFDAFGSTEALYGGDCDEHAGIHVFEDQCLRRGRRGAPGDHELHPAHAAADPLRARRLRGARHEPCACGRSLARIGAIAGRADDVLDLPAAAGGTVAVHPIAIRSPLSGVARAAPLQGDPRPRRHARPRRAARGRRRRRRAGRGAAARGLAKAGADVRPKV